MEIKILSMELCQDRHRIPQAVDGAIFPSWVDPLDVQALETMAYSVLKEKNTKELDLYVTGLTVALVAVINVCNMLDIDLILHHYNKQTHTYYKQWVWRKT